MTKLNQPSATRSAARAVEDDEQRTTTVEDDEQRSATTPGRAKLQIDEQRFRLASFNWRALLQIGIAFSGKKKRERGRGTETKRWRDKKNETEKEIGSNEEMETREERERERESYVVDGERCVGRREKSE